MMSQKPYLVFIALLTWLAADAQVRVGINTPNPERTLDITGSGEQYIRVRNTAFGVSLAGLELIRGGSTPGIRDWRIQNNAGNFNISTSLDNFSTGDDIKLYINGLGNIALGGSNPATKLQVSNGSEASLTENGYMMLGSEGFVNMVFDRNEIIARNGGAPYDLMIQSYGGHTNIGFGGGDVFTGDAGVGTDVITAPLSIVDDTWQLYLRNQEDDINDWYIGASNSGWSAGADQLVFSPTSASSAAQLRLMDVTDNNGTVAPLMIHTNSNHILLMDGNEIDTKEAALFFNYNTQESTIFNSSGGKVGIGTTNPQGTLHVRSGSGVPPFAMYREGAALHWRWQIANNLTHDLNLQWSTATLGTVNGDNGQYSNLSDMNFKRNVREMPGVLDRVLRVGTYSYYMAHDPEMKNDIGVLAQELQDVIPEVVRYTEDQYGVSYGELAVFALRAIQEQQQIVADLENKIATLKSIRDRKGREDNN